MSAVTGSVKKVLRVEGFAIVALAVSLYAHSGAGWGQFAWLFFVPDLSFAGYLFGARVGAVTYNTFHSLIGPLFLAAFAQLGLVPLALTPIALIWAAHVGFDRAMGYGLKYADAFRHTHLGIIGREPALRPQALGV